MNIEELLPDGEWKSENEYVVRCPFCGDHPTHNHCHVNPTKRVFFCHYCGESGSIEKLLKEYEITGELEPRKGITEKKKHELTDFSQFPKITGVSGTLDLLALTYLKKRDLSKEEIELYSIRFSDSGKYYGRVLVPIREDGRLVCFVGRSFMSVIKPKYLYPHTGETILTANEAIFGYENAGRDDCTTMVITEGVFDAMAANRITGKRGLAILSNHLSKGQFNKLLKLPRSTNFFVALDSDAHEKAIEVAETLWAEGRNVSVVLLREENLKKKDPASISKDELIKALEVAEQYSFCLKRKIIKSEQ